MSCVRRGDLAYAAVIGALCAIASSASADSKNTWQTTSSASTRIDSAGATAPAYSVSTFGQQAASVPLEFGLLFAGISYIGVSNWNWGSSHFRFHPEGWFGNKTGSGGTDKLGHF